MSKRVAFYTRVSTSDGKQTTENQLRELTIAAERLGVGTVHRIKTRLANAA